MVHNTNLKPLLNQNTRSIGLELEFLAVQLENGQAATRDLIKQIWRKWGQNDGVETYIDFGTKQPIGVIYTLPDHRQMKVDSDAGVSVIEFGFLPFPTLQACENNLKTIIKEFLDIANSIGVGLISYGLQPQTPYYFPDLKTEKLWYRTFPRLYERGHSLFHNIAANQPNIDVSVGEALKVVNTFNALSPLFIALFANSGVGEWKIQNHLEEREWRWNEWLKDYPKIRGIPENPFDSLEAYFEYNWSITLPAIHRHQDNTLHVIESNPKIIEYLQSNKEWLTIDVGQVTPSMIKPEIEDINQSLQYLWIQSRLKMEFDKNIMIDEILDHWKNKNLIRYMELHLNKLFIETRCIAQQPWDDVIAPSALLLGLIENIEEAIKLVEMKSWGEWRALRENALTHSMKLPASCPS